MQHPELVSYYNGLQAKPYLVFIEFNKTYLTFYDEDMQYENAISVALKNCTISETDNILYVYINNTSSAYLAISKENSWYASLKTALKQNENTWFSKLQQQKWYTLLLILLLLAGSFYSLFTYVAPVIAMEFVSVKQEEAFGRNVYHSFVNEEKIDDTLSQLTQQFVDAIRLSEKYHLKTTVVKNKGVNAFALPGGNIIIYSGILKTMNSPEEFVALLSHEATHVNKRHSLKSIFSSMGSSIIITVLTQGNSGIFLQNADMLGRLKYSRNLEQDADNIGMNLMLANHINPIGMRDLMQNLEKANDDIPCSLSFIS